MDIFSVRARCNCKGIIFWDLSKDDYLSAYERCPGCTKLYRIEKLPIVEEVKEMPVKKENE